MSWKILLLKGKCFHNETTTGKIIQVYIYRWSLIMDSVELFFLLKRFLMRNLTIILNMASWKSNKEKFFNNKQTENLFEEGNNFYLKHFFFENLINSEQKLICDVIPQILIYVILFKPIVILNIKMVKVSYITLMHIILVYVIRGTRL